MRTPGEVRQLYASDMINAAFTSPLRRDELMQFLIIGDSRDDAPKSCLVSAAEHYNEKKQEEAEEDMATHKRAWSPYEKKLARVLFKLTKRDLYRLVMFGSRVLW